MSAVRFLLFASLATTPLLLHGATLPCTATTDRTVNICSPVANSTNSSPVQITAAALDKEHPITAIIAYANSTKVASSTSGTLSASVALAAGSYSLVVRAWDSSGYYFSTAENFTVSSGSPTVTIAASPNPIQQGQTSVLTVTATNATSVKVTDNVDDNVYNLPDTGGTISVSPAESTVYTATASNGQQQATASVDLTVQGSGDITAVNHVVFLMQENRSFDTYFGMLNPYRKANGFSIGEDGKEYDVDGIDDKLTKISNKDDENDVFTLFHSTSSCLDDMTSAWLESYGDVNRYDFLTSRPILMDGFVHTAEGYAKSGQGSGSFTDLKGQRAMAYYTDEAYDQSRPELNYYYWMSSQFALSDRWFSPVASKTIPNRIATIAGGTTQGYVHDPGNDDHAPQYTNETIFQLLDAHQISWKIYYAHVNSDGTPSTTFTYFSYSGKYIYRQNGKLIIDARHIAPISQYYTDVANGTLPRFSYLETDYGVEDEHPGSGQSILSGQQFVSKVINSLMYSPSWKDSVFFLSFDEAGGPYDHVPPVPDYTNLNTDSSLAGLEGDVRPIAVNPDGYLPCTPATLGDYTHHCDLRPADPGANSNDAAHVYGFAAQIGFRVPNMIVSPFSRKHYVGHLAMDHTAVVHFLEERYGLPNLTNRDKVQPDLLDFFDFANPPWATPPSQSEVPVPPTVGPTCHPTTFVP